MTHFKKSLIASFALIAMSVSASQANANTYGHIQQMALDIQLKSDVLLGQTHHYVQTPNYQKLLRCISEMRRRAVKIHVLSIQRGCLIQMANELRILDAQFHDIEAIFDATEIQASYGNGRIRGATSHVKDHLNFLEDCIKYIRADIATLTRPVYRTPQVPRNSGISIGYSSGYRGNSGAYRAQPRSNYKPSYNKGNRRGYSNGHRGKELKYNSRAGISYSDKNFSIRIGF